MVNTAIFNSQANFTAKTSCFRLIRMVTVTLTNGHDVIDINGQGLMLLLSVYFQSFLQTNTQPKISYYPVTSYFSHARSQNKSSAKSNSARCFCAQEHGRTICFKSREDKVHGPRFAVSI